MKTLALVVAALCVGTASLFLIPPQGDGATKNRGLPSGWHHVTVYFQNRPLHCIVVDGDGYGVGSGVSCDWGLWNRKPR